MCRSRGFLFQDEHEDVNRLTSQGHIKAAMELFFTLELSAYFFSRSQTDFLFNPKINKQTNKQCLLSFPDTSSVNACPPHLPGEFLGDMANPHSRLHGGEAGSLLTSGACGQMLLEHGQLQRCHGVPGWPQVRKYGDLDRFLFLLKYL